MYRHSLLIKLCLCVAIFWLASNFVIHNKANALSIQQVRFGLHPDKTRLVVELDQSTAFKAFVIENPYRLVVDLPAYKWNAGSVLKPKSTIVRDLRTGSLSTKRSRLVVDLNQPAAIQSAFLLPQTPQKPYRLVIDFKTISPNEFKNVSSKHFGTLQPPEKITQKPKVNFN